MASGRNLLVVAATLAAAFCAHATALAQTQAADLSQLSIEELGDVQVTSVSKRPEAVGQAASAIYVITQAEIARSGAASLPEILRLAPNLQVTQAGASRYVITARGMNGNPAAQNFANKLLVLIDGRTVYSPLYSGVYWDMQDVLPQDVERIEVISGPGATLWGSNAVNGVINIITRTSSQTQGGLLTLGAGDQSRSASLRLGGKISETLTYRVYAKTFLEDDTRTLAGQSANDHWSKPQAGFRLDWSPTAVDTVTLRGDAYDGYQAQQGAPAQVIRGGNVLARWNRSWQDGSTLQVQTYYDRVERGDEVDGSGFRVDTYDLDIQQGLALGGRHQIVFGGGYRLSRYQIDGTSTLLFSPAARDLKLFNAFVQDTIALTATSSLVLGAKLEDDPYSDPEWLPTARLSWSPSQAATVWAAASRAVRAATPFDRDVVERLGGVDFLVGGDSFRSEKLTAYELGAKLRPSPRASLSVSAFYNDYDRLRSIELAPAGFLPLRWGNGLEGHTYGVEAWGDYQAAAWWRLSGAVSYLDEKFKFTPGASGLLGVTQTANDPKYQASLKSSMDLGQAFTLDTALRYVSALPNPRLPAYTELNGRLGWNVTDRVQVALVGRNLLHAEHREYTDGDLIPRSVFVDLQWRF
jgi:iron complex outermembrane receptor protein